MLNTHDHSMLHSKVAIDPTLPHLRFATTRLRTGPLIHYAEQGDPNGDAIILLHGWPDSWFSFSRVLPLLPAHSHVYALDQRGFGNSERPECCYTVNDFAADVVALLDAVGIASATIVGHSFGSFVARQVAEAHPTRVARVVLIGSAVTPVTRVTVEVQQAVRDLPDPVPTDFARVFQASTIYHPVPEAFFERIVTESVKLPARLWRAVIDGLLTFEDAARLPRITAPTLIVWGAQDALFPRDQQDRLVQAIAGARLLVYAETGHCPNWERPEQVVHDLDAFMHTTLRES